MSELLPIWDAIRVKDWLKASAVTTEEGMQSLVAFLPNIPDGRAMGQECVLLKEKAIFEKKSDRDRFICVVDGALSVTYDGVEYAIGKEMVFLLKQNIPFSLIALADTFMWICYA